METQITTQTPCMFLQLLLFHKHLGTFLIQILRTCLTTLQSSIILSNIQSMALVCSTLYRGHVCEVKSLFTLLEYLNRTISLYPFHSLVLCVYIYQNSIQVLMELLVLRTMLCQHSYGMRLLKIECHVEMRVECFSCIPGDLKPIKIPKSHLSSCLVSTFSQEK